MPRGSKPGEHRGGRKAGTPNKATTEVRDIARGLVEDPDYRAALKARLKAGTAGTLEVTLWAYAYGRAGGESSADGALPTSITIHF